MPSVLAFAEYQNTDTRQRCALPSARTRALGKHLPHGMPELCRVPAVGNEWHSANCHLCRVLARWHSSKPAHVPSTRARRATPVGGADGVKSLPSATTWPSAKGIVYRVPSLDTRQKSNFAECLEPGSRQSFFCRVLELRHSAKLVKFFFGPSNFFGLYLNLII